MHDSRKLATYNFSSLIWHPERPGASMWNQTEGNRFVAAVKLVHIGTTITMSLGAVDHLIYDSDSCTGQQRNMFFSTMCIYYMQKLPHKK